MTGSVKQNKQPAAPKAAKAAPNKKSGVPAVKPADQSVSEAASIGVPTKVGTPGVVKAATATVAANTPAAGARRKPAAAPVAKAAAAPPATKAAAASPKAESGRTVKLVKPVKPGKVEAAAPKKVEAPAAPAKKPALARAGAAKAKLNKRSAETIAKILETTGEIILQSGADRISILDVCEQAGISRGTFYRYFSSQEELLDAFSRHRRDQFHAALLAVTAGIDDPDERFQAVLGFVDNYLEKSRARRLLLVAPEYALRWFQRIFNDSVHRFRDILSISFDAWEQRRGITLDRELICELMVRFILSEVLVPSGAERRNLMRRIERFVVTLLSGRVARR